MHPAAGIPDTTGGVLSILMVTGTDAESPLPFVAEHVRVTPALSAFKVVGVQPEDAEIPEWGSMTLQLMITLLRYQPLFPNVPTICGVIAGGVLSIETRVVASPSVFGFSTFPIWSRAIL